jgi:hypothetical protein
MLMADKRILGSALAGAALAGLPGCNSEVELPPGNARGWLVPLIEVGAETPENEGTRPLLPLKKKDIADVVGANSVEKVPLTPQGQLYLNGPESTDILDGFLKNRHSLDPSNKIRIAIRMLDKDGNILFECAQEPQTAWNDPSRDFLDRIAKVNNRITQEAETQGDERGSMTEAVIRPHLASICGYTNINALQEAINMYRKRIENHQTISGQTPSGMQPVAGRINHVTYDGVQAQAESIVSAKA